MVPYMVALGIVTDGFSTSSAGTVADSIPRNAKKVRVTEAVTASMFDSENRRTAYAEGREWIAHVNLLHMLCVCSHTTYISPLKN